MSVPVRFGTDGVRGRFGEVVTADLAYRLGRAVAQVFSVPVFVGYDTRESSPGLAGAVIAGLSDGGARGVNLGYFTTPGVAHIARARGGVGVVVSASHNPYYDNGLKLFGLGGAKLDGDTQGAIEAALGRGDGAPAEVDLPDRDESAEREYVDHLRRLAPADLSALSLVVDCANGAASRIAYDLYRSLGATVVAINDRPNGRNINATSGSTHLDGLVEAVRAHGADLGLALDGDADRLIAVDGEGTVRDGDDLLVLFALDQRDRGVFGGGLVVTSMSNLGLNRALEAAGVTVAVTDVGDRHVARELEERGWTLGGEQSGHVIFRDMAPTGDGLLTGLVLCELVARRGPLAELAGAAWRRVPQVLLNVASATFRDDVVRDTYDELVAEYAVARDQVRLVLRPSGTEPVVRVMIESTNGDFVEEFAERLRAADHG